MMVSEGFVSLSLKNQKPNFPSKEFEALWSCKNFRLMDQDFGFGYVSLAVYLVPHKHACSTQSFSIFDAGCYHYLGTSVLRVYL